MSDEAKKAALKKLIETQVFFTGDKEQISLTDDPKSWIFDFRRIVMNGKAADLITEIFCEEFLHEYPFQIGTLEIGGVPIATSIMTKLFAKGHTDSNAFFIRKSRKKSGLHRKIEGRVEEGKKVILVDDVLNSGNSFWRQVEVLEELGHTVDTIWSLVRYRDEAYYKRFHLRGIKVRSIFELNDFTETLGEVVRNITEKKEQSVTLPFTVEWIFRSENPSLGWVCGKSQPILDDTKLYFGSDNRRFWALHQSDGSVAWSFQTGIVARKKAIFSNPALYKDSVIFGSYDGNIYCLDKHTGKVKWISFEADWVGSSPAVAEDLGLVFVGLEFGLIRKMGGIIALDIQTGEPVWIDRTHKALTHCSPFYIKEHQQVVMGSNDGIARLHDAKSGKLLWTFTTYGASNYDTENWTGRTGFSSGDIKEGFVYSHKHDYVVFGSVDGFLYVLDRRTGHLVKHVKCDFGIFGVPYIYKNVVYFSSTDKRIRCLDLDSLELIFTATPDNTRMFGSPTVINNRLYIGTNAGKLHELDAKDGRALGYFQATERITNAVVYNQDTDTYFLPTYANEIIALKRANGEKVESSKTP